MVGREMRGERKRQPKRGGKLRAEQAGAQDPQFGPGAKTWRGLKRQRRVAGEQRAQFDHVLREVLTGPHQILAQRLADPPVSAGGAAKAKIDPSGKQCIERAELLGNHEGIVIGQHDTARTDPDSFGGLPDMTQNDRGRAAGNTVHRMMLGDPETVISGCLRRLRQQRRLSECLAHGSACTDGNEIKNRKPGHLVVAVGPAESWSR